MAKIIEKIEKLSLPVVVTKGLIVFPEINVGFEMNRPKSRRAVEHAEKNDRLILVVSQKYIEPDDPSQKDIFNVGTIAKVKQTLKLADNNVRLIVEGLARGEISAFDFSKDFITCDVLKKVIFLERNGGIKGEAAISETMRVFEKYCRFIPKLSDDLLMNIFSIKNPGLLCDYIASNIYFPTDKKQKLLEEFDPFRRLEKLCVILEKEIETLEIQEQIHRRVRGQIDKNQRDYFLREQLKALKRELGEDENYDSETEEYFNKLKSIKNNLTKEVYDKLHKEILKFQKQSIHSAESTVIRNYLDVCFELPWNKKTVDFINIAAAEKILDDDHYGLEKVKERILEFIAVKQLKPELKGQILCFVGPPGVGKTSVASSIAKSLKRKYTRMSLGGVRDESDIRGHRKTYIGSMPGRIINAVKEAGSLNPLILLDEIDKLTRDSHGDPASALLEALDSEQNKAFRDHYIELPIDLSDCLFIATANTTDTIPRALLDRMEVINITSYTRNEKHAIAKNHLVYKQAKKHGLNKKTFKITDDALYEMIDYYTREAGVRNLERELASLCRKCVKKILEENKKSITVNNNILLELLGQRKFKDDLYAKEDEVGVVNGLAWTSMGGDILQVEAVISDGTGKIELTGSLGDVMKESAKTAISFIRTIAKKYNIEPDFYKTKDIHIHFPEGAVPKDGPSAGITVATAIFSQLTGYPARSCVAMTGEITLRGKVLPIGGLKEKTVAAYKSKIKNVILPDANIPDLDEIDKTVRESLNFIPVKNAESVFENAIIFPETEKTLNFDANADGVCLPDKPELYSSIMPPVVPGNIAKDNIMPHFN
ncbi:MAG: endopeptidase La [Oscillospiraceae bacterium]|nr:endopeptidase La [Oscillospiraceae bacterium]